MERGKEGNQKSPKDRKINKVLPGEQMGKVIRTGVLNAVTGNQKEKLQAWGYDPDDIHITPVSIESKEA